MSILLCFGLVWGFSCSLAFADEEQSVEVETEVESETQIATTETSAESGGAAAGEAPEEAAEIEAAAETESAEETEDSEETEGAELALGKDEALEFSSTITDAKGNKATIVSTVAQNKTYLFLPTYADTSKVVLSFEGAQEILINGKAFASGDTINLANFKQTDGAWQVSYMLSAKGSAHTLYLMKSANVRSMFLISADPENKGRAYIDGSKDHSTKASGTMLLVDPDGSVVYNGELSQIKGRGNSTWEFSDKKPYQIKLGKKTDLLETGDKANKNKTWVLLANSGDPTLIRNTISYKLGTALGLESTPECDPVDLYYDGEYRGSYLLCEKVQINSGRVDITSLDDAVEKANEGVDLDTLKTAQSKNKYGCTYQFVYGMAYPDDYTGGYLIELDNAWYASERCWFQTTNGNYYVIKEPENLSAEQVCFVSEKVQELLDACESNRADISTFANVDSLARTTLIEEFAINCDYGASSTYFYLPAAGDSEGNIIYGGPIWDFDTAYGIRTEVSWGRNTNQIVFDGNRFWVMKNSSVTTAERSIFNKEMLPILKKFINGTSTDTLPSLDALVSEVEASEAMNEALWGFSTFRNSAAPYDTYEENVAYLKNWISKRITYLEGFFAESSADTGEAKTEIMHRLYNPYTGEHFYTADSSEKNGLVKIGWKYEGVGWTAPKTSNTPVYRLFNKYTDDHHYTTSLTEYKACIAQGWTGEGIGWYSDDAKSTPLYRQFNPYEQTGTHNYTADKKENDNLVALGWRAEGIAWYGVSTS